MNRLAILTLLFSALSFSAAKPAVEDSEKLGFGFRRVTLTERSNSSFEGLGHFAYLFYRDQKLSRAGAYSISPGGTYAIYHDVTSGHLILFRRVDRKITQLTLKPIAPPKSFAWHEGAGTVDAQLERKRLKTFPLRWSE